MLENIPQWVIEAIKFGVSGGFMLAVLKLFRFIRDRHKDKANVSRIEAEASRVTISTSMNALQITEESMKTWLIENKKTTHELLLVLRHLSDIERILDRVVDIAYDLLNCNKSALRFGKDALDMLKKCNPKPHNYTYLSHEITEIEETVNEIEGQFVKLIAQREHIRDKINNASIPPNAV